ncbi:peroxidase 7-like [Rutidosis leptorrhynchoides]|uniref:peroxidase 7-like n=1 Tax=Rutidosis leptorrhynchoides TaxID=125765 RepID=UPI003A99EADE
MANELINQVEQRGKTPATTETKTYDNKRKWNSNNNNSGKNYNQKPFKKYHPGDCLKRCDKCKKNGHLVAECKASSNMCYGCGTAGHFRKDFLTARTTFRIDVIPIKLGRFHLVVGMDWLAENRADIVCRQKDIRIPVTEDEPLMMSASSNNSVPAPVSPSTAARRARHPHLRDPANVVAEALSRKEKVKPIQVRALNMTVRRNLTSQIRDAQLEALKEENIELGDDTNELYPPWSDADTMTTFLLLSIMFYTSVSALLGPSELKVPRLGDFASLDDELSYSYYDTSCSQAEGIIFRKVHEWVKRDATLAPSIIRLHFHDCAVRGCDASILLDHSGSEKHANVSKSLRGFELINDIKAQLEKVCPKTVSCADILTTAARDATVLAGGPFWMIPFGRKDGRVSLSKETGVVPMGRESITQLIQFFQSKGLNVLDLTVLSGAHTIGRSTCESLQFRLYNYKGTNKPDPSIDPKYLNYLRKSCRWGSQLVYLDTTTPRTFDIQYYQNLKKNMGLLSTDQLLYSDSRTQPIADALSSESSLFSNQFSVSMVKLANVLDARSQDHGEIRTVCSRVN